MSFYSKNYGFDNYWEEFDGKINNENTSTQIIDDTNTMILWTDASWLKEIQEKSKKTGPYSTEWQFSYYSAIGKLTIDDETLYVNVPLMFINYPQKVSHSHIGFNFEQVEIRFAQFRDEVEEKFKDFYEKIGKELTESLQLEWSITQNHNTHAHPQGIKTFSGTDNRISTENPGIMRPYKQGKDLPIASSLMHYDNRNIARWTYSEFHVFNGNKDQEKAGTYAEGNMIHIITEKRVDGELSKMLFTVNDIGPKIIGKRHKTLNESSPILVHIKEQIQKEHEYRPTIHISSDFIVTNNTEFTYHEDTNQWTFEEPKIAHKLYGFNPKPKKQKTKTKTKTKSKNNQDLKLDQVLWAARTLTSKRSLLAELTKKPYAVFAAMQMSELSAEFAKIKKELT